MLKTLSEPDANLVANSPNLNTLAALFLTFARTRLHMCKKKFTLMLLCRDPSLHHGLSTARDDCDC